MLAHSDEAAGVPAARLDSATSPPGLYFELLISFDLSAHYLEKKIRKAKPTGRSSSFPDLILSPVRGWIDAGFDH